ncbi:hypothetical protein GGD66_002552 [Bradyrhizobium sp. CIR48]|nr:hypothetical protein [Bradyrhizobium sp. CIR48]
MSEPAVGTSLKSRTVSWLHDQDSSHRYRDNDPDILEMHVAQRVSENEEDATQAYQEKHRPKHRQIVTGLSELP